MEFVKYKTKEEYLAKLAEINVILGFPSKKYSRFINGVRRHFVSSKIMTRTWATENPSLNEDNEYVFPVSDEIKDEFTEEGNKYYIDPAGNNDTGDGSISNPWLTLYYACTQVATPGDIIHINPGTYVEDTQCNLAVGVNIEGEGNTSIINSTIETEFAATILLHSSSEGTNGNQSISYIKMDGNETAWGAIQINARSNVLVHHCEFVDFFSTGVIFNASTAYYGPPTTKATGNKYYNNTSTNCSDYPLADDGQGHVMFGGQDGMLIYNNTMTQTGRATKRNGYLIKFYSYGYNEAFEIYNNTLTRSEDAPGGVYYDFAIELWHTEGGAKVYDNDMVGGIDVGGGITYNCLIKNGYDYGIWIHNNNIIHTSMIAATRGIYLERNCDCAIIEKNWIENMNDGIILTPNVGETTQNHRISYNVFNEIGYYGIRFINGQQNAFADNIKFYNNVLYTTPAEGNLCGIGLITVGTTTNIDITNNIIIGFDWGAIFGSGTQGQTIDGLIIKNNITNANGNGNLPRFTDLVPTNYINSDNIIGDNPDFVTDGNDYHLQSGSPAINTGLNIGLTKDYDDVDVSDPPEIGAYEYN